MTKYFGGGLESDPRNGDKDTRLRAQIPQPNFDERNIEKEKTAFECYENTKSFLTRLFPQVENEIRKLKNPSYFITPLSYLLMGETGNTGLNAAVNLINNKEDFLKKIQLDDINILKNKDSGFFFENFVVPYLIKPFDRLCAMKAYTEYRGLENYQYTDLSIAMSEEGLDPNTIKKMYHEYTEYLKNNFGMYLETENSLKIILGETKFPEQQKEEFNESLVANINRHGNKFNDLLLVIPHDTAIDIIDAGYYKKDGTIIRKPRVAFR